jgi:GNAT superfamily N-acetyltransferase
LDDTDDERAFPEGLDCAPLTEDDLENAFALSQAMGSDQTMADWRYLIGRGHGWGCRDEAGDFVAAALSLPYGREVGWIGMVMVAPEWRRKGVASALVERCIDALLNLGLTPGLDSTEAAHDLYARLGFHDIYPLTRMQADRPALPPGAGLDRSVRPLSATDMKTLMGQDLAAFGSDREEVLRMLMARAPGLAAIRTASDGYIFGRDGLSGLHLGPLVAGSPEAAIALTRSVLSDVRAPVRIDIPDHQYEFRRWLETVGFRPQANFTRMLYRHRDAYGSPRHTFAIAGLELG